MLIGITTKMGVQIHSKSIVLCNGTFMNGLIHLGEKNQPEEDRRTKFQGNNKTIN